jgi:pimeloyl-ACP methyl ester carboxylesterase
MFEPVVEPFAKRYHVIVPDLGHGRSRRLPPLYTATQLASDLSRLLDHLRIDSTAVLGYALGGAIAQQLALDDPERCARLVLACTYAFNMATFGEKVPPSRSLSFSIGSCCSVLDRRWQSSCFRWR